MIEEEDFKEKTNIILKKKKNKKNRLFINLENTIYSSIKECFINNNWEITNDDEKSIICWYDNGGSIDIISSLFPWQIYNHFTGIWFIARKVELLKNYEKMTNIFPKYYNYHPKSYLIPAQLSDLKIDLNSNQKKQLKTFIIKPDRGSQGKGIFLIQDYFKLDEYSDSAVAQEYINPFLINGFKFDLRIYVLITSLDPLRIYIHKEGMARFCTEPYENPNSSNLDKTFCHLTNFSLNKKNNIIKDGKNFEVKKSLTFIMNEIEKFGGNKIEIQSKIDQIIGLTIISIYPTLINQYRSSVSSKDGKSRCFEILGFDILIDSNFKPWLIEINNMPSLRCDSEFDKNLKYSVLNGCIKILNIPNNFKKLVLENQKAHSQKRIIGNTNILIKKLFDPIVETKISESTNWRLIYPNEGIENNIINECLNKLLNIPKIIVNNIINPKFNNKIIKKKIIFNPKKNQIINQKEISFEVFPNLSFINNFSSIKPFLINENDEKNRINYIKMQISWSDSLNLKNYIKNMLNKVNNVCQLETSIKKNNKNYFLGNDFKPKLQTVTFNLSISNTNKLTCTQNFSVN